jgi:hypothetical protein
MKIRIEQVDERAGSIAVRFDSACGRAIAQWNGPRPTLGEDRHVELSLERPVVLGADMVESDSQPGLSMVGGVPRIVGHVIEVDEGFACIDIGCGRISVDVHGELPALNRCYSVTAPSLAVFDEEL